MSAKLSPIEILEQRLSILEQDYADLIVSLTASAEESTEEEFMSERQRWIDTCRERAAEKRRTS